MEDTVFNLHTKLKKDEPKLLVQCTRSCDFKILKLCLLQDKNGTLSNSVVEMREHDKGVTTIQPLPESIFTFFCVFSPPKSIADGVYETSVKGLPDRKLFVHTKNNKYYVTTEIAKVPNVVFVGVHVTVDLPTHAPPLLRGIMLVGFNRTTKKTVSENLTLGPYLQEIASNFGGYVKDLTQ